jgi:TolB protein
VVWIVLVLTATLLPYLSSQPAATPVREIVRTVIITPTPSSDHGKQVLDAPPAPTPTPIGSGGTLAFTMRHNGNSDIYLLSQNSGRLLRLTHNPNEDRSPTWSPDGRSLAFASNRGGGWDLYTMDMRTGTVIRLTHSPVFEAGPTWSPDGRWLAYEAYDEDNLDIHILNVETGENQKLTDDPAPDYSPAWSPDGRTIAFTSHRNANQDLYIVSLDDGTVYNLTNTPNQNENHPAWSPDGSYLAYSTGVSGDESIWRIPYDIEAAARGELRPILFGVGGQPTWSPDGEAIAFVFQQQTQMYLIAANITGWALAQEGYTTHDWMGYPDWTSVPLDDRSEKQLVARGDEKNPPHYTELLLSKSNDSYTLVELPDVNGSDRAEKLSDRVNDSYNAMREAVHEASGWDYLSILGDSWRPMNHTPRPGQGRISWHVCGRAVDVNQSFLRDGRLELVREDIGGVTYWRVFIKAAEQDGSLGEPLRTAPWNLSARSEGGSATADGGKLKPIPDGYYVDFTTIAADFGWERRNALPNWRNSYYDVEWWHFQKTEGMSWYECMLEVYDKEEIQTSYGFLPWWTQRPEWEVQAMP